MAPGGGMMASSGKKPCADEAPAVDMSGVPWHLRGLSQVVLLSLGCFCIPGGYNAVNSLAGGVGDPATCQQAGVVLYAVFTIFSIVTPAFVNMVGARIAMALGGVGYPFYILTLLLAGKHQTWGKGMILVGGAVNGLGAALLWTGQGALTFSYATPETRGAYFAIFWIIFNAGGVLNSFFLVFLVNLHSSGLAAGDATFIGFIAVMLFGCVLFMILAPLHKVVRPDGTKVVVEAEPAIIPELVGMGRLLLDWRSLLLVPMMLYSNWCYNFQFAQFNAPLFDSPTKGLNNTLYWGAQMVAAYLLGFRVLDSTRSSLRARAGRSLVVVCLFTGVAWAAGVVATYSYGLGDIVKEQAGGCEHRGDCVFQLIRFSQLGRWFPPMLLYVCWGAADALVQVWVNWCLSQLTDSAQILSRYAGLYKVFNSAGNLLGGQLNSIPASPQLWINVGMFLASVPTAAMVVRTFKDHKVSLVEADV